MGGSTAGAHNRRIAEEGEDLAADWYSERGYEIVSRNWRCREGELDLVVRRGRLYVFVEVKARSSEAFGAPAESVGAAKQARVRRLAARWLEQVAGQRARAIRFDVVAVLRGSVDVVEGAF